MGVEVIATRSDGQTILQSWFNVFKSVLDGNVVPRDSTGTPVDGAGSLGDGTYNFLKLFVGLAASGLSIEESAGTMIIKVGGTTVASFNGSGFVFLDGSIAYTKLAQQNFQKSSSCGNYSSSSPSHTPITNFSVALVTSGQRNVRIEVMPDGSLSSDSNMGGVGMEIILYKNAVILARWSFAGSMPSNIFYVDISVSAGTQTYSMTAANTTPGTIGMNDSILVCSEI